MFVRLLLILSLLLMPLAHAKGNAQGDSQDMSDAAEGLTNSAHGDNIARVENEYKLYIPAGQYEAVWQYLLSKYKNDDALFLRKADPDFSTKPSIEFFKDDYFDTESLDLLHHENGIRHRARYFPNDAENRKNGRELIQIKLKRPMDRSTNRTEFKYPVKYYGASKELYENYPCLNLIKREKRDEFIEKMQSLGINPFGLKPTLSLNQERRRIYIALKGNPYATITLDHVDVEKWWQKASYEEVEIELNEIAFTEASAERRAAMQEVNDVIKNDLQRKFSGIKQDQTPKYNKAFNHLSGKFLLFPLALQLGIPMEVILGVLLLALAGWLLISVKSKASQ